MEAIITGGRMYASERPQGCKSHQAHQTAFRCWGSGSGSCDRQLVVGIRRRFHNHAQWDNDWTKCSVAVPDTACHWYVVNPDNTFGKGFSWITAPEFDIATLRDIGIQHEVTVAQGHQTTVELMDATSGLKYGDDY
jgi:hypothetical protein